MISQSDNGAATRMIDRLGFKKIEQVLRNPRYELYDPNFGGGLWVGKRYAKGGRRYPDPVLGTSHGATVSQVCRFYYLLAFGKLVNPKRSSEMLDILAGPEIHHKFVYSLERLVPDATVFRKSGSWRKWHSDSVLVWGPVWRRYIVAALIEDADGEQILRKLIPEIETVLQQ
jgi:beta-lactamase class A